MIAKLTGIVDSSGEDWAVIDVGGVGYLIFCSGRTLGRLNRGESASVMVETHVREDHIHLYGFIDAAERDWFRLLTTVQGVGAKVALAILGTLSTDALLAAIASGDRAAVTRAPGVGPKLATRILSELREKVGGLSIGPAAGGAPVAVAGGVTSDAVSALVNLGYGPTDALRAVTGVAAQLGEAAVLEDLIRSALAELAPREHR